MVGRKQLSSAVHRERFLLNGIFVDRFQAPSGQAFCLAECWLWEKFLQLFLDRTRPFLHRLWRLSSGHEEHDIWKPNHHYCTTFTLDRDELGAALLFWNSNSDRCCCEHAAASWRENDGPVREGEQVILKKNCPEESRCREEQTEFLQKHWSTPWFPAVISHNTKVSTFVMYFVLHPDKLSVCLSGNETVKSMRQFYYIWTIKPMTHSYTHTYDMQAHTYVQFTHAHTHPLLMHACVHTHSNL